MSHYDFRFLKPLNEALLRALVGRYRYLFTVEDGILAGGFGSAILEALQGIYDVPKVVRFGIPDRFVPHGTIAQLQADCGYSPEAIVAGVKEVLGKG